MNIHLPHPSTPRAADTPDLLAEVPHLTREHTAHLKAYGQVIFRPIRTDDESRMIRFHESLSDESIYLRYFGHISLDTRTLHERLARVCANTADSYAIVAERHETRTHPEEILAVGRLTTTARATDATFAMLMTEKDEDTSLPRELLKRLVEIARAHGFHALTGELLVGDHVTLDICRSYGFEQHTIPEDGIVRVRYKL